MDHLCYLCLMFVMLSRLFITALWSPAGIGLASWLLFVMFDCIYITFPLGILGQVWYLIVSIHDLCHISYFQIVHKTITTHDFSCRHSLSQYSLLIFDFKY